MKDTRTICDPIPLALCILAQWNKLQILLALGIIGFRRGSFGVFLLVLVLHHAPCAINSAFYVNGMRELQFHELAKNLELYEM